MLCDSTYRAMSQRTSRDTQTPKPPTANLCLCHCKLLRKLKQREQASAELPVTQSNLT